MTIQTIMIVKKFQRYFSVSFNERSLFAFKVSETIRKLSFGFSKIRSLTTYFTLQKV